MALRIAKAEDSAEFAMIRILFANSAWFMMALASILQGESLSTPQLHYLVRMILIFLPHYTTKPSDVILLFSVSFSLETIKQRDTMLQYALKMIKFAQFANQMHQLNCKFE
jgi:hypothetical protein